MAAIGKPGLKTFGYGFLGLGMHVPERVLSNADLEKMVDTNDEWITSRTGIKERRIVADNEATSDLATEAARRAIENAGIRADEIELIICCTFSPDMTVPNTACLVQRNLGIAGRCPAFDLNAACTGFVYGVSVASAFFRAGLYKKALVIGADVTTRTVDYTDRATCVLFGDGAGAAALGPVGEGRGLAGEYLCADGTMFDGIIAYDSGTRLRTDAEKAATGSRVRMKGGDVFKFATRALGHCITEAVRSAGQGLALEDIDLVIPHQANLRIIEAAAKRVGIPMEKVYVNIQRYGNTSAATIPMAMAEAAQEGRLRPGELVALVSFGGGLTYGANLWVW